MMRRASPELPVAVVGMACRFPGANNLDEYWQLIRNGRSGIIELPPEKLDRELYYDPEHGKLGRTYTTIGGVVPETVSPAFQQRLPKKLLENTDPAHLVLCEVAAAACQQAGYDPFNLPCRNTGVYIGHSGGSVLAGEIAFGNGIEGVAEYLREDPRFQQLAPDLQTRILRGIVERVHREKPARRPDGGPELAANMAAGIVAEAFGLEGPALATDAACASSLMAVAMGVHALRQGLIDVALVGGASCNKWYALVLFSMAQSISATGSRPFDADADGLVSSDGYAVLMLKTLPRALADGDRILGVIQGVGISSDGRGKSLWAPRKEGQILAIQRAYGDRIDPAWLQYIECHATSTQVGDSTELSALTMALRDRLSPGQKLPIGSVKANIGHTLESAGIAGMVKALLCMQHRQIPGQINFRKPNPEVPWHEIPFYVPTQTIPWPDPVSGRPRRTAVNAFGIGGLNVHVVLDDQPTQATRTQIRVPDAVTGLEPSRRLETGFRLSDDEHAIAIVGLSAILPGALTLQAFWELLVSGRDALQEVPPQRWNPQIYHDPHGRGRCRTRNTRGGYLTDFVYDWKKHKVPPKQITHANPLQFMLLDAADQALRDAGYDQRPFDRQRAAVVVGSVYGGDFACDMQMGLRIPEFQRYLRQEMQALGLSAADIDAITHNFKDLLLKHLPALLDETGSFTASTLASRLTKTFDLMGGAFSLDAGDTSSLAAISTAMGLLHDRSADLVLCAAGQRSMDINVYEALQARETLAADRPKPAFSSDRDGIVPGEGAVVIVLKRLVDAQRDGDRIRGVIRGFGVSYGSGDYGRTVRQSLERALTSGQIDPAAVEIVESASIGHRLTDQIEAETLTETLKSSQRKVPAVLTSVSAQIGHTLGASGLVSVAKACLELDQGQVPATPGLTHPLPAAVAHPEVCRPAQQAQPLFATLPSGKAIAAVINSAANGAVYTLLLEGGQNLPSPPPKAQPPRSTVSEWKTVRLAAPTRAALVHELRSALQQVPALFASGGLSQFSTNDRVRLALVVDTPETLSRKLELSASTLERSMPHALLEQQGIFYREMGPDRPRVAFLFPGQGSQYPGMLQDLVATVPQAVDIARDIDTTLQRAGCPSFAEMTSRTAEKLGADVLLTQLAILTADVLVFRVLQSMGFKPDIISGHSYGEYPALVAAGALTLDDAIRATRARAAIVEAQPSTQGSLLSTTAPCDLVESLSARVRGAAYLACHNAPDQTVIGGTFEAIQNVQQLLEAEGFVTRVLAVPRPYHTPLLTSAKAPYRRALAAIPIQPPRTRFLSNVTLEYVNSSESARENLVEQLTTPVRYVQLVQKLADEGVSVFLEVGPHQVLSRLNQRILAGRAVTIIPSDSSKQPARECLERVRAALDVADCGHHASSAGSILFFDATQRRKSKLAVAQSTSGEVLAPSKPVATLNAEPSLPITISQLAPSPVSSEPALDRAAIQAFMIRFVVEQTGYPEDMVELDADLEADLGIDSIKKAQLIGELAENFDLKHLAGRLQDLSLDDFRSLRSLLDFVTASPASTQAVPTPAPEKQPAVPPVVAPVAAAEVTSPTATASVTGHTATETMPSERPAALPALDRAAIQAFMIRFVVEQTGYPEDMVELDADLEADLGIDSIKKAQLIGELAENFDLKHLAGRLQDLSLDDFRSLRSLLDFVTASPASTQAVPTPAPEKQPAVPPAIAPVAAAEVTSPTATASVTGHTATETMPSERPAAIPALDRAAIQAFMIRFVVEQTGYPEDMVELDADLEADLGIDSIKKAQLIGELAENFDLKHLAGRLQDLSLDDFRSLRSLLDFVTASPEPARDAPSAAQPPQTPPDVVAEVPPPVVTQASPAVEVAAPAIPAEGLVMKLRGTPYEMGRQHGKEHAAQIRTILERYASLLGPRLQHLPELDEAVAKPTMYFGEEDLEELRGIADGAGLPFAAVLAENLGMYPDYVPGCTQFAFTHRRNPKFGLVHAVNEDSPLALTLPDCLARVVQVRHPAGGIPHVTFSVTGQVGGLNGINAAGLAISSTLLLDRPRRSSTAIGHIHPVIVKRLLQGAETIPDALALLRQIARAGAWSLCLSHFPTDRLCYVEYDGDSLEVRESMDAVLTTNHCLLQAPLSEIPEHSKYRLVRLQQLMAYAEQEGVSLEKAQQALRDRYDLERGRQTTHATMNTIRRVDNQISVVMRPEAQELYVTPGPLLRELADRYFRLDLKTLWDTPQAGSTGRVSAMMSTPAETTSFVRSSETATPSDGHRSKPLAELPPEEQRVVQRHVLRIREMPWTSEGLAPLRLAGGAIILGNNKLAAALRERLQSAGHTVHWLTETSAVETTVAEIERLWQIQPLPHLFLTTARDAEADVAPADWSRRRSAGVWTPYFVCQRWMQLVHTAQLVDRASLVGVTALGGDWGFSGRVHGVEGGGIAGLLKGIRREFPALCVKVIDAPYEETADHLAACVLQEMRNPHGPLEVSYIRNQRYVVRAIPQPASTQRTGSRRPQGVWVVTGGARGVTAVVARELGRRFGLKLHLIGSTALTGLNPAWRGLSAEGLKQLKQTITEHARAAGKPPAQAWKEVERLLEIDRTLEGMRADGIDVTYHACDVTDSRALEQTLHRIRQQHGPIRGVIHGAGVEAACRFDKKKRDSVLATLRVKVDAAMTLATLTADDPLDYFLAFGSTSGRFGGLGQTDYSMASDLLVKICDWLRSRRPSVAAIGFHWPPWSDVGMAARPESKIALQSSNLAFMPPLEGVAHIVDELLSAALEGELLFLDKPDQIDSDGIMPRAAEKEALARRQTRLHAAPLLDTLEFVREGDSLAASVVLDPHQDPFLREHRHLGVPILPAVVGLECLAEAAHLLANDEQRVVGIRGMIVHQGLRFHTEVPQRVRVTIRNQPEGWRGELRADFCDRQGRLVEAQRLQMEALVELGDAAQALPAVDLGPQPREWTTHHYVTDWRTMKFPEEARVYHGYPFRALRDYAVVDDGVWARLVVPRPEEIAGDRPAAGWLWPSATLDAGLLAADLLVWNKWRIATLPHAFNRIRLARVLQPGESLTLRMWLRDRSERSVRVDFVMLDAQGHTVLQVEGYELIEARTGTGHTRQAALPQSRQEQVAVTSASAPSSPAPAPLPAPTQRMLSSWKHSTPSTTIVIPAPAPLPVAGVKTRVPVNGHHSVAHSETAPAVPTVRQPSSHPASLPTDDLPLIDAARWHATDQLIADLHFDPVHDLFLTQHRFEGKPLLPAVIGLETLLEAASLAAGRTPLVRVRHFEIFAPLRFRDDAPKSLQVEVTVRGSSADCRLLGTDDKRTLYQMAEVEWSDAPVVLTAPPLVPPPFPYSPMQYAEGSQAQLVHGPLFRGLKSLMLMRESGWAKITAPAADNLAGTRRGKRWFLPMATLDSCLVACGVDLFILMNKRVEVPQGIEELQWTRLPEPNEACTLRLYFRGSNERQTTYDWVLYGAKEDVVLIVKGYRGIRTSKDAEASLWENDFRLAE